MATTPNPNGTPVAPVTPPPTGTIDITDLVNNLQDTWVTWATNTVFTTAVAAGGVWTAWLAWPVIGSFFKFFIKLGVTWVANTVEMAAFFMNTAIRKASQAHDYVAAKDAADNIPVTATQAQVLAAEQAEMAAFRNFVMVTN